MILQSIMNEYELSKLDLNREGALVDNGDFAEYVKTHKMNGIRISLLEMKRAIRKGIQIEWPEKRFRTGEKPYVTMWWHTDNMDFIHTAEKLSAVGVRYVLVKAFKEHFTFVM